MPSRSSSRARASSQMRRPSWTSRPATITFTATYKGLPEKIQTAHGPVLLRDAGVISFADTFDLQTGEFISSETLVNNGPHPEADSDFTRFCEVVGGALAYSSGLAALRTHGGRRSAGQIGSVVAGFHLNRRRHATTSRWPSARCRLRVGSTPGGVASACTASPDCPISGVGESARPRDARSYPSAAHEESSTCSPHGSPN